MISVAMVAGGLVREKDLAREERGLFGGDGDGGSGGEGVPVK